MARKTVDVEVIDAGSIDAATELRNLAAALKAELAVTNDVKARVSLSRQLRLVLASLSVAEANRAREQRIRAATPVASNDTVSIVDELRRQRARRMSRARPSA